LVKGKQKEIRKRGVQDLLSEEDLRRFNGDLALISFKWVFEDLLMYSKERALMALLRVSQRSR